MLRAKRPDKDYLNTLLQISNRTLASFGQPPLYEPVSDPSKSSGAQQGSKSNSTADYTGCFHISIAWSLTEPFTDEKERMKSIDIRDLTALKIDFDCVKAKIGNNISSILL